MANPCTTQGADSQQLGTIPQPRLEAPWLPRAVVPKLWVATPNGVITSADEGSHAEQVGTVLWTRVRSTALGRRGACWGLQSGLVAVPRHAGSCSPA